MSRLLALFAGVALLGLTSQAFAKPQGADIEKPEIRAASTVSKMTADEKLMLVRGILPMLVNGPEFPADAVLGAGYVPGVARLGVPSLKETDASLGVSYLGGLRKDGATALPSGLAQAATWNPDLIYKSGAMIGAEARAKGFNVMLAGGVNLVREPRAGRNFEYFSEDPLLSGVLAGSAISGVQSNNIISTIKHFAFNDQETGRKYVDVRISEAAARESDLLAFQIGIERGRPGSVMCAYNLVRGQPTCASDWLLNKVLKQDWGYKGFVMSDWGAVPSTEAALHGLDQQSGFQLDRAPYFGDMLKQAVARDPRYRARLDDMNRRILTAVYAAGLDAHPAPPREKTIDYAAHAALAQEVAGQGIVLLRNEGGVLPLANTVKRIAVIGGYADGGVLSGGGSSQVQGEGGPALVRPFGANAMTTAFFSQQYHRSVPLEAIKRRAPQATVSFRDGRYITDAVETAKQADVAIVFATQWMAEGVDAPDLSLPDGQDALIAAVAAANPRTIVVLETGGAVLTPWLDSTAAVIEAWYPGARGGEAIASILFGDTNPSGHLPISFPASLDQLPRKDIDGQFSHEINIMGDPPYPGAKLVADYDIEGSDVGYRWYARTGQKPRFPFGFGLSYTTFAASGLTIDGLKASFRVANTGLRAGEDVAQLYLVSRVGSPKRRLVGFQRISLAPGASGAVSFTIDPRLLADWRGSGWTIPAGEYRFAIGTDSEAFGETVSVRMQARNWKD